MAEIIEIVESLFSKANRKYSLNILVMMMANVQKKIVTVRYCIWIGIVLVGLLLLNDTQFFVDYYCKMDCSKDVVDFVMVVVVGVGGGCLLSNKWSIQCEVMPNR